MANEKMVNDNPSRTSALTAYSASAGSGKTFRITREYLKLLLERPDAARMYRNILAVTFTNKATEEMKGRIVAALNELAGSDEAKLQSFCEELAGEGTSVHPGELQRRALEVRSNLLHDYSRFSVFTIDKFFQKVLHAFVNEAGLHPGFAVELDTDRLLEEAVSSMMENAGSNEQQMGWLMQLVQQRIDDGKSWDMKKELLALGREIFKEAFGRLSKTVHEHLNDKTFLQRYLQKLRALQKSIDDEMQSIAAQAQSYLAAQQLTEENFKGKSRGFIAYFKKIARGDYEPNVSTRKAVDCIEEWASKNTDSAQAAAAYEYLNPLLARACRLWDSRDYQTAGVILKNFMVLGLLTDIAKQMRSIANEDNLMPISDSVHLIHSLIDGSDAPFIYEKAGATYRTFMIDEFQDTSAGQWRNFCPLVSNSLAEGNPNMVVGDVKQSIYRWRNGDWRILAYGIDEDLKEFGEINRKPLNRNFRSLPQVVEFNNELFRLLSTRLQAALNADLDEALPDGTRERLSKMLTNAYKDCRQLPQKTGDKGYVRVEFVEENEEKRAADAILERLPLQVAALQDSGYSASDIAILTRNNRQGQMVADALIRYRCASGDTTRCFDVVSQDSLFLNASPAVRMAIALLRIAAGQQNTINEAFLSNELSQHADSDMPADMPANMHTIFFDRISKDEHAFLENLTLKSLPEAFEAIIQRYKLNELREDLPFLQGLHDLIVGFSNRKLSDAAAFLAWWDESGKSKPLYSPDKQNAITIATIHKSKGLQYKVVIVPFASWELDTKIGSTVWMTPTSAPFDELPCVPLSYSDKLLRQTIFSEQQSEEKAQACVDSLNLLYVALTRAEEQLYIFAPLKNRNDERKRAKNMAEVMVGIFTDLPDGESVNFGAAAGRRVSDLIWEFGCSEAVAAAHAAGEASRDKDKENMNIPLDEYPSTSFTPKLRLRYEARELFEQSGPGQRTFGLLKHKIFERLRTPDDIPAAIERLMTEGWAARSDAEALRREVELALEHPQARAWFDGSWRIYAEAEILLPAPDKASGKEVSGKAPVKRPDRVMVRDGLAVVVDYKFGSKTDTSYVRQVEEYVAALRQMGYSSVEGYVWYVSLGEVQKV
ncbi:MAG: UvrD-helicase domain-containing protein [Prevotellaceae bacterium]|jgi:ATP-dependent exoDNAse (exonuclease V) beta subunit|nr:UvrD-helicase domain-containing protein [Prevotellaceae bacterium]